MKEPFEEQKRPKAEEEESLNGLNGGFLDLIQNKSSQNLTIDEENLID